MNLQKSKLWLIKYSLDRTMWIEADTIEEAIEISRLKFKTDSILEITIGPTFYRKISKL